MGGVYSQAIIPDVLSGDVLAHVLAQDFIQVIEFLFRQLLASG